ncbi:MAG: TerB family tellurite resistance protein [Kordiimonadaceae bacterium]|nr:TerB family tellurite resistance protein [Kordiimonadaceae bacterium]
MGIVDFSHIIEFFGGAGTVPDAAAKKSLVEEVLLLTLSRATSADSNIGAIEVETVQKIILEMVGAEVSCKDIRVAAISDLYKEATLEKYLSNVAGNLELTDKQMILQSLSKVIEADEKVSPLEVDFFNTVASALGLTPAQLTGLV